MAMNDDPETSEKTGKRRTAGRRPGDGRTAVSAIETLRTAREQFEELTGYHPESVSALSRTDDGWRMTAEVVELERVPDTMSLLASYAVTLDDGGDVLGYERVRRYTRGREDRDC